MSDYLNFLEFKTFIASRNMDASTYIHSLSTALTQIALKRKHEENKQIIKELVAFTKTINDYKEQYINTIRNICASESKIDLLREYKDYFESLKNITDGSLKLSIISLCVN